MNPCPVSVRVPDMVAIAFVVFVERLTSLSRCFRRRENTGRLLQRAGAGIVPVDGRRIELSAKQRQDGTTRLTARRQRDQHRRNSSDGVERQAAVGRPEKCAEEHAARLLQSNHVQRVGVRGGTGERMNVERDRDVDTLEPRREDLPAVSRAKHDASVGRDVPDVSIEERDAADVVVRRGVQRLPGNVTDRRTLRRRARRSSRGALPRPPSECSAPEWPEV